VKTFKFFTKPFNPRDYDIEGFTFIGVSPIKNSIIDNREYRVMIYMDNRTNTPILANRIRENEEPYNNADIIQVIDNRIYQLPRIDVTISYTRNETI
jgi:hypothetical protein